MSGARSDTPPAPLAERVLGLLNRIPLGERRVRVAGTVLYPTCFDRYLAAQAWKLGLLEAAERRYLARAARPGMVAVDVGANIGVYTALLAKRVGASGRVHALEPDPANFLSLERAVEGLPDASVRTYRLAAWSSPGSLALRLSDANRGDHRTTGSARGDAASRPSVTVEAVALDDLLATEPRVDLVKIDAQGAEVEIVAGATRILERSPGVRVLCELCPRLLIDAGTSDGELFDRFGARGLVPHVLDRKGTARRVDAAEASEIAQRAGHVNLVFATSGGV